MVEVEKKGRSIWFWLTLGAAVFVMFVAGVFWLAWRASRSAGEDTAFGGFGSNIGVVDVDGVIVSADQMEQDLRKLDDDDSVKAIILHVNSPGGGAAASQEIYSELMRLRTKHKKPIVTSVETVGASGAYYIASATDKIYANKASVVGSIGVIAEWVNFGDLMQWAKLKEVTLQAGSLKAAGTPTRDPTPEERAYLQSLVDDMHQQFIADVAAGRKMPVADITEMANGRVWTGQQALPLHLIDKIGTFDDCLRETAASVGISGEPNIVKPVHPRPGLFSTLDKIVSGKALENLDPVHAMQQALEQNPNFYFIWK